MLDDGLTLIAGGPEALAIHQDTRIYAGNLLTDARRSVSLAPGRKAWLQMISGGLEVNGQLMRPGDGLAIENTQVLELVSVEDAHFLLFDLRWV